MPLDLDLDERGQPEAHGLAVEHRPVAGDRAVVLEGLDAAQARRWRQVHALGEGDVGDPALLLEDVEETAVDAVEGHVLLLRGWFGANPCPESASPWQIRNHMPSISADHGWRE